MTYTTRAAPAVHKKAPVIVSRVWGSDTVIHPLNKTVLINTGLVKTGPINTNINLIKQHPNIEQNQAIEGGSK